MTEREVIELVNQVFVESFEIEPDKLKPEMQIFTDLGLDSLDIVDLIAALQKKFKVQFRDDGRIREIRSLNDLYRLLLKLKEEEEAKSRPAQ